MTTQRFALAFTLALTLTTPAALAAPSLAGGDSIGNGLVLPFGNGDAGLMPAGTGNPGPQVELAAKCAFHWTATCDKAFGIKRNAPAKAGEGLPLPVPMPWRLGGGDGVGI